MAYPEENEHKASKSTGYMSSVINAPTASLIACIEESERLASNLGELRAKMESLSDGLCGGIPETPMEKSKGADFGNGRVAYLYRAISDASERVDQIMVVHRRLSEHLE